MSEVQRRWDIWNLQALFPEWGAPERQRLLARGAAYDAHQQVLFADPVRACRRFGAAAAQVLAEHPALQTGLTISLHLGPYSLAPVPWLITGRKIHVLINRGSLAEIKPIYDSLQATLDLPGTIVWVPIEGAGFALRLFRALRRGEPVFAYLDGNDGLAGSEGTLRRGIVHRLPGRTLRVRTGLARLALRLRCPVHSLVTVWDDDGEFAWQRGPTWRWPLAVTPAVATGELFTWGFDLIRKHPAQWRAWNMLTGAYDSFRAAEPALGTVATPDPVAPPDPWAILSAEGRAARWRWCRPAVIWPGDMLEDVAGACFYAAEGLEAEDVALLESAPSFTPSELTRQRSESWLVRHLPRLVALGFVAPVQPPVTPAQATGRNPS